MSLTLAVFHDDEERWTCNSARSSGMTVLRVAMGSLDTFASPVRQHIPRQQTIMSDPLLPHHSSSQVGQSSSASRKLQARRLSTQPTKSSKAKGKERETFDVAASSSSSAHRRDHAGPPHGGETDEEVGRSVTIRFTGGQDVEPDLEVWVESRESVSRVKDKASLDLMPTRSDD
jgi:hypothetical protein